MIDVFWLKQLFMLTTVTPVTWCPCTALSFCLCVHVCVWSRVTASVWLTQGALAPHTFSKTLGALSIKLTPLCLYWSCMCVFLFVDMSTWVVCVSLYPWQETDLCCYIFVLPKSNSVSNTGQNSKQKCKMGATMNAMFCHYLNWTLDCLHLLTYRLRYFACIQISFLSVIWLQRLQITSVCAGWVS